MAHLAAKALPLVASGAVEVQAEALQVVLRAVEAHPVAVLLVAAAAVVLPQSQEVEGTNIEMKFYGKMGGLATAHPFLLTILTVFKY